MDPATIGAIAAGVSGAITGIAGAAVAIYRTQKNSVTQKTNEQAQDAVRVDNHGSKVVSILWGCFSYSSDPDSTITLNEADQSGSNVDAVRLVRGYNAPPPITQQPGAASVPGLANPAIPLVAGQPAPQQPQPDIPLGDVNVAALPQLADNKNHCKIARATSGTDGSWTLEGLEIVTVPEKSGGAKDTHYCQEITASTMPAIEAMVKSVVKQVQTIATKSKVVVVQRTTPEQPHNDNPDHHEPSPSESTPLMGSSVTPNIILPEHTEA